MLRERHRSEVRSVVPSSSRRRCSNRSGAVPEVGLIPGNRFLLLPLKKVTALVRPHTPCREPTATSTKPCISSHRRSGRAPPLPVQTVVAARSSRHHRRSTAHRVAKAHLSPVSEHHEPLLDQVAPQRTSRSRDISIFTLSVEQAQLWRRSSSNADLVRTYRKPAGSRHNRVAPNYYPDLRSWSYDKVAATSNYYAGTDRLVSTDYYGDLRSSHQSSLASGGEKLVSRKRNSVAHPFRAGSPFLCSFTNEHDLPFGPSPLHRRSGRSS